MDPADSQAPDHRITSEILASPPLTAVLREIASAVPPGVSRRAIARRTGVLISHMSMYITKLAELDLVRCTNPYMAKGRRYLATSSGQSTSEWVQTTKKREAERISEDDHASSLSKL